MHFDDNDPIVRLSDQICALFPGHRASTIVAALASCLGVVLEQGKTHGESAEIAALRFTPKQVVAEIVVHRLREGARNS